MYPEIRYIQDIAGEKYPIAPFSKSSPKDRYAILSYHYDEKEKLTRLQLVDCIIYQGQKIDSVSSVYAGNGYGIERHIYGKEGNLWKIEGEYARPDTPRHTWMTKYGRKYQKTQDVFEDGYLRERVFLGEGMKQIFRVGKDRWLDGNIIYCEWVCEKENELYRYVEKYDDDNRLISQHEFSTRISNPADVLDNDTLAFYYDNGRISQINRTYEGGSVTGRDIFLEFDTKGNWLKYERYLKRYKDTEEKLGKTCVREIAYDEAAAIELRSKFEKYFAEHVTYLDIKNSKDNQSTMDFEQGLDIPF